MNLAHDLLIQARHLAGLDAGRPKQANLRRASSAAYYSLFHFLIWESARIVPKTPAGLRDRVCRTFHHNEMKQVCLPFSRGTLTPVVAALLHGPPSREIRSIAKIFVDLQEIRHNADYDLAAHFSRLETLQTIERSESAQAAWGRIRNSDEANVFLAALAFGARWAK
ncbi:MAG: hypothetical protein V4555_09260 [Acidobacteriota bacterium]